MGRIDFMPAYKRSIFLINKPFQFRFSFFVCTWLFFLTLAYPFVIYQFFGYLIRYVSLDPFGPPLEGILKTRQEVSWIIVVFQIVFVAVFLVEHLPLSPHRGSSLQAPPLHGRIEEGHGEGRSLFPEDRPFPGAGEGLQRNGSRLARDSFEDRACSRASAGSRMR